MPVGSSSRKKRVSSHPLLLFCLKRFINQGRPLGFCRSYQFLFRNGITRLHEKKIARPPASVLPEAIQNRAWLGSRSYQFIIEKGRGWEAAPTGLLLKRARLGSRSYGVIIKKGAAGKPLLRGYY